MELLPDAYWLYQVRKPLFMTDTHANPLPRVFPLRSAGLCLRRWPAGMSLT